MWLYKYVNIGQYKINNLWKIYKKFKGEKFVQTKTEKIKIFGIYACLYHGPYQYTYRS